MGGLSGKAGTVVFVRQPNGAVYLRPRVTPRNPRTPAQEASRALVARAALLWRSLTVEEAVQWNLYALEQQASLQAQGIERQVRASALFTGLVAKFLQVDPNADPPRTPPSSSFDGDGISVQATSGTGSVTFTANAPNAPGVVSEILLQPVTSVHRKPMPRAFRHAGFHRFEPGGLDLTLTSKEGWVACGLRFVRAATGQASAVQFLGTVHVG